MDTVQDKQQINNKFRLQAHNFICLFIIVQQPCVVKAIDTDSIDYLISII